MAAHPRFDTSRTAWLSRAFEVLANRVRTAGATKHFDVLIVGSGYGGAIAADVFAGLTHDGKPISVAVLERGNEYLSGAFPAGLRELPRHIRRGSHKEGLFDIRLGSDVTTVVANGLGGGSLINAGVMAVPADSVFTKGWPKDLSSRGDWDSYFHEAANLLGSRRGQTANTILSDSDSEPQKYRSLEMSARRAGAAFEAAALTMAMSDTTSSGNVQLKRCVRCGDCATGCNFGAKNSLDVNLLVRAQQKGAEIFCGATVLQVLYDDANHLWLVDCVPTNAKLRARGDTGKKDTSVTQIRAAKVVLAAGTLGSTEILLRSRQAGLAMSDKVGQRCSTNGDMLIAQYNTNDLVHTVADEAVPPSQRGIGPTITGIVDLRSEHGGVVIEEMSVPASLRRVFAEMFATINTLQGLESTDWSTHRTGFSSDDLYGASAERIARSALYAVMGDDGAAGTIKLESAAPSLHEDGIAHISWPGLADHPVFETQVKELARCTNSLGGRLIPNPVWKLLPKEMEWLLKNKRGPLATVHPLGGCAMADSAAHGVVDDLGRVFKASGEGGVHDGLVVLDGSIIPTALGINPALTIAAVALRAARGLADKWGYREGPNRPVALPLVRPVIRATDTAFTPTPTEVEIIERLVGPVTFMTAADAQPKTRIVELTLRFAPKAVADLYEPPRGGREPVLRVAEDQEAEIRSRIRIYDESVWREMEKRWSPAQRIERELEAIALFSAPLSGTLRVLERTESTALGRILRAGRAWFSNRGKRDIYQAWFGEKDEREPKTKSSGFWKRICSGIALASRGGEVRALVYKLGVGSPDAGAVFALQGTRISGRKSFTYSRRGNPWRQLMEVELGEFPGMDASSAQRVIKLDTRYLARIGVPLFRVTKQQDGATALAELASFVAYFVRLLLGIHIWSFRAPDEETAEERKRKPDRLPSLSLEGLPEGEQTCLPLKGLRPRRVELPFDGRVILTRYRNPHPDHPNAKAHPIKRPLLMLHGYSASGTTFAHSEVADGFAAHFWKSGRDVWIADLRTSSGQEQSARQPWSFEDIAAADIPRVFEHIRAERRKDANATAKDDKIDVIAHCMGSVVFSMAVLDGPVGSQVNKAAFTQVGPLVVFSPANIFRAYVLRYLIDFLPDKYEFRPERPTLADDLLDRLLSTLPYPVEEFDYENPSNWSARTPWTRTRHRMDALYGRDFNVANMEKGMLARIDDHFGPLSLRTVTQTLHFVHYSMITTFTGLNRYVSRQALKKLWSFPTLSVHGEDNGLAHVSTVDRMRLIFEDAGKDYDTHVIPGAGHQDALVGTKRGEALAVIEPFLEGDGAAAPSDGNDEDIEAENEDDDDKGEMVAYAPWIGPLITERSPVWVEELANDADRQIPVLAIRLGVAPTHRTPEGVVLIRGRVDDNRIVRPDDATKEWDAEYVRTHMAFYRSNGFVNDDHRWDAFLAPLPEHLPGSRDAAQADGLLALVVYSESQFLSPDGRMEHAYFRINAETGKPEEFDPLTGAIDPERNVRIAKLPESTFRRAANAVADALRAQLPPPVEQCPARDRRGHPVLVRGPRGVRPELPIKPVEPEPPLPKTAELVFGTNTASGVVLGALGHDPGVMDGFIPYDSPRPPPAAALAEGTSFALLSCQYPAGLLDEPVAYASYRRLLARMRAETGTPPRFVVLTGDQVYVDPTAGLYDPSSSDGRYSRPYEVWLRQEHVRDLLRRIPSFMLLDDHEIDDNWEPLAVETKVNTDNRGGGVEAYERYQRAIVASDHKGNVGAGQSFTFKYDGFPFFMLDTRSQRSARRVGELKHATLFDADTLTELRTWLCNQPADVPKFVVTPAMLLPRHRRAVQGVRQGGGLHHTNLSALHSDGWDGYPSSLQEVLGFIAAKNIKHVVFLSGDEHRGCVARIELFDAAGASRACLHSLHTTAAFAPFPFANSSPTDFVLRETIRFGFGRKLYRCVVDAAVVDSGDGALLLRPHRERGIWKLDYEYADGGVQTIEI
jgi:cholesterol oxidase